MYLQPSYFFKLFFFSTIAACFLACPAVAGPTLAGCEIFPQDNIWNVSVSGLPVDSRSSGYISTMGENTGLHPDFGSGTWNGGPIGIPITLVDNSQVLVPVSFDYADESDLGPYPIPDDALIEGGSKADGDRHVLILNQKTCILHELFNARPTGNGSWHAGSGARFDLSANDLRPDGWTSADAAGLPILPGLVRYEELASGHLDHAIRFTAVHTRKAHLWPARHDASSLTGPSYPPMGQRFRLKASVDISGFSPMVKVLLQAMKTYGLILADNGSNWYISGVPDDRWDNDMLRELRNIKGSNFEAVDVSSLMVNPNSGKIKGAPTAIIGKSMPQLHLLLQRD
jgi:hypothetical protein